MGSGWSVPIQVTLCPIDSCYSEPRTSLRVLCGLIHRTNTRKALSQKLPVWYPESEGFSVSERTPITNPLGTRLGSFRKDYGDGNKNGKKAIGLLSKTTTLHVHHTFLYLSWPSSLHDYDLKITNVTPGGRKQATTNGYNIKPIYTRINKTRLM